MKSSQHLPRLKTSVSKLITCNNIGMKSTVFDLVSKYMDNINMHKNVAVLKHIYHTSYLYLLHRHTLKISSQP